MPTPTIQEAAQLFLSKYLVNAEAARYAVGGAALLTLFIHLVLRPLTHKSRVNAAPDTYLPRHSQSLASGRASSQGPRASNVDAPSPRSSSRRSGSRAASQQVVEDLEIVGTRMSIHPHPDATGSSPPREYSPATAGRWLQRKFTPARLFDSAPAAGASAAIRGDDLCVRARYQPRPQSWQGLYSLERRAHHILRRADCDRLYAAASITERELERLYNTEEFVAWYAENREALLAEAECQHHSHILRRATSAAFLVLAFALLPAFSFANVASPLAQPSAVTARSATMLQLTLLRLSHLWADTGVHAVLSLVYRVEALALVAAVCALASSAWMVRRQSPAAAFAAGSFFLVLAECLAAPLSGLSVHPGLGVVLLLVHVVMKVMREFH